MPTYRNDSNITYGDLPANGGTLETEELLDSLPGVVRISDTPYYNPAKARHDLQLVGSNVTLLTLEHPKEISRVVIRDADRNLDIFINSPSNAPAIPLSVDEVLELVVGRKIEKLYLSHSGDTNVTVLEI